MLPHLPWPKTLYALKSASTGPLYGKHGSSSICECGCCKAHRNAVSKVVTEQTRYGQNRRIVWFHSLSCRVTWEKANDAD